MIWRERASSSWFCLSSTWTVCHCWSAMSLTLRVGPVLADHHERREKDRLERDDHRQQAKWVVLDAEADPAAEPGNVAVDEGHRSGERRDPIGDSVLHASRMLLGVAD
jgi:hypothetical protein